MDLRIGIQDLTPERIHDERCAAGARASKDAESSEGEARKDASHGGLE